MLVKQDVERIENDKKVIDLPKIDYKFSEDKNIHLIKDHIDETYKSHYSENKFQATEFILDSGHGTGFCIGNILKYAQRFGGYPILRPKFLATDKSNELLSWKHAINLLNKTNTHLEICLDR